VDGQFLAETPSRHEFQVGFLAEQYAALDWRPPRISMMDCPGVPRYSELE
jgi:hypothetical protein